MTERLGSGYELIERIGRGAMGDVWRAEGPSGPVAVKILRPELAEDPDGLRRFVQERTILRSLSSPHIVAVEDLVLEQDRLGIVMELVEGSNLRQLIRRRSQLSPALAAEIVAQALDGLAVAHAAGVVHRDLKPENILLAEGRDEPLVKIVDFGVARIASGSVLTQTSTLVGTPKYLAPELGSGGPITPAADVYAAGIVLYELLFGRVPFDAPVVIAVIKAHAEAVPTRPSDVPDALWSALETMLAKDPARRPSAQEAAAKLRSLLPALSRLEPFPLSPTRTMSRRSRRGHRSHDARAIHGGGVGWPRS